MPYGPKMKESLLYPKQFVQTDLDLILREREVGKDIEEGHAVQSELPDFFPQGFAGQGASPPLQGAAPADDGL